MNEMGILQHTMYTTPIGCSGCCWKASATARVPFCFYPPQYGTFQFANMTQERRALRVTYERARPSAYPRDFRTLRVDFAYLSDDVLQVKVILTTFTGITLAG